MGCCSSETVGKKRLVYTCSGCCDLGRTSDILGRKMRKEGIALSSCSCLAGIAADIPSFINTAREADETVCINGCELCCATKIIDKIDIKSKTYILTEFGLKNGEFHISEELINKLYSSICNKSKYL